MMELKITRKKHQDRVEDFDSYGTYGRRINVRQIGAVWNVFCNGHYIGIYRDQQFKFYWKNCFSARGTWAEVKASIPPKLMNELNLTCKVAS